MEKVKVKIDQWLPDFIKKQMEKLGNGEISVEEAKAQASLAKQYSNDIRNKIDVANHRAKWGADYLEAEENT